MSTRRRGAKDSATRRTLLDATARVMTEEGYAAATTRRVAAEAGVKPALVHYYFPTMEDLFLAVFSEGTEANFERQMQALTSDRPLHALWELSRDPRGNALMQEFIALANHRKAIRTELMAYARRYREIQVTAFTFILREHRIAPEQITPVTLSMLLSGLPRLMVTEANFGFSMGHDEMLALVEHYLDILEPPAVAADQIDASDQADDGCASDTA
ncbi:TetR/AcrR family transcriptional regulator [Nocardia vinacea]|uniref:TetR/AcrR family transcriptional regulator n=1 Tax=Nocardia vinacea TaxID=96468 RepID=UPI000592AA06|nr:TetR/AcrR family transcriptional regulator [Nocardia vinacea]